MAHRKLTLLGATKRPPKSRSIKLFRCTLEFNNFSPKAPHRHQHHHHYRLKQQHNTSSATKWTSFVISTTLIAAIIALVQIKYCTATESSHIIITIAESNHHTDTKDKPSEISTTTTTKSINISDEQQQLNLSSSSRPIQISEDSMKFPLYMRIIATLFCLLIFSVGVCGNLLVPLVVIKTKYLRNSTNLFLINLSIADLLVLIVCMPTVLIELHSRPETWLLGEPMCKLSNYVEMLAANGSIFTILAISFERYYAICKPLKAGYKCTRLRATIIICLIWLLASILTSPILIMAKSSETIYIDGSLVYNCILETNTYWHKMYVFVSMFAFFCLPLLVLMLVYWLIGRRLIRENLAMSRRTATTSYCPSTATASTDLISVRHERHTTIDARTISNNHCWFHQATGNGPTTAGKRIRLRKAASLKSISDFFASFSHYNHDHNHRRHHHHRGHHQHQHQHNHQQDNKHHPSEREHQQYQLADGQQQHKRQLRLRASKAFSLDSHSSSRTEKQSGISVATNQATTGLHGRPSVETLKMRQHGLSNYRPNFGQSSCCCCCCCRHRIESSCLPTTKLFRCQKGGQKNGTLSSIFNQLQLTPARLWGLARFWSIKKEAQTNVSRCSTSIEIGSNQDQLGQSKQDDDDDDDDCNNNNNDDNLDAGRSTNGGGSGSCSDITGLSSSSCHSKRTDGITIMNSISESMPIPAVGGDSQPDSGIANGRLVVVVAAAAADETIEGQTNDEAGYRGQLPAAEYANDDDDDDEDDDDDPQVEPAIEGPTRAEVDDRARTLAATNGAIGRRGLRSWLANSLCSYSRQYCRNFANPDHTHESRSSEQDNGPLMAADKGQSSSRLIAIRRPDEMRQRQQHHQRCHHCWQQHDDKSAEEASEKAKKGAQRQSQSDDDDNCHYEHLNEPQQQAKKSAHFDISLTNCTLSTGCCCRRHRNEAVSHRQQQPSGSNVVATQAAIETNADVFDSFDSSAVASIIGIATTTTTAPAPAATIDGPPLVRRPDDAAAADGTSNSSYAQSNCSASNSKSPSPDSILHGVTFRRQHQSDQIMENPLEEEDNNNNNNDDDDDDETDVNVESRRLLMLLQSGQFDGAYPTQRALKTTTSGGGKGARLGCSRPSSVAALSGSSASSVSCATNTTTAPSAPVTDRDSLSNPHTAAAAAATTILFVESGKSYQQQQQRQGCQEAGKQMMATTKAPITSDAAATTTPPPNEMSSDQYNIKDKSSRANSLVLDSESSVKGGSRFAMGRMSSHHLAKRFRTRSASKPIVCSQLHNGAHLSELLVVHDLSKKQQMDSRRQVVIMLAFVVTCFFLLFFPYRVFTIWLILSTDDQVQSLGMETYYNLTYFSRILIYLHSAINPIAYNLISTKFRRAFMSILLCRGSSTRRHYTTDHQQRLANQLSQYNRKSSGSTTNKDHQQQPFMSSQPLAATNKRQVTK